ncbi:MAG: hypothetical protein LBG97_05405 [Coriobacteriales bacterium]|jgi:serine/threonine-protein kinase|nr:hypothetical protein [Coriobacteriales bacterium]
MGELLFDFERFHELDEEHVRLQTRKWRLFLTSVIFTILFGLGAIFFATAANIQAQHSYDSLLEKANELYATDAKAAALLYGNAIRLSPGNPNAYQDLLTQIKSDNVLTADEKSQIKWVLDGSDGAGTTNEHVLKEQNPTAYAQIAYDVGVIYYFGSQGDNGKPSAVRYLNDAANSSSLDPQKRELAARLSKIASNYELFLNGGVSEGGASSVIGNDSFTPRQFWDELVAMSDGDLVVITGNTFVAISVYGEVIYQISNHADIFVRGGVTLTEMQTQLDKIAAGLKTITPRDDEEQEFVNEAIKQIQRAREVAATAAGNVLTPAGGEKQ